MALETAGYIGEPPLYTMLHRAEGEARGVVVIASPFAEEKKAAQRALVEMARDLAAAGQHVLRFDFRGTGDSAGEFAEADVQAWLQDLHTALAYARQVSADLPLSLLGLRFGATLAYLAAPDAPVEVANLALWEPIVSGSTYMRQNRQRSQIRKEITDSAGGGEASASDRSDAASTANGAPEPYPAFDFDGFLISSKLHREMVESDLLTTPVPACRRLLILQISGSSRIKKPLEDLKARAVAAGIETELDNIAVEAFWSAIGLVDTQPVRERTTTWLVGDTPPSPTPVPALSHAAGEGGGSDTTDTVAGRALLSQSCRTGKREGGGKAATGDVLAEPLTFMSGDQRVHGVLYRPDAPVERAVLLLHGWSGYRIGPGHLLTEAARALAEAGHAAYSFDFRGRGESEWEVGQASLNSMIRDATRAVPVVLERTGAARVTLLGLCSGSEVALGASLSDERIDTLALWSAPIFSGAFTAARQARRSQANARKYVQKLFYGETWAKLFSGRLNYRMIARALGGGRSNEDSAVQDKAPDTAAQMKAFEAFRGRLFFIYASNDPETVPSRDFYREFVERTAMPHRFYEVAGANHNYYSMVWKREIIEQTIGWLESSAPAVAAEQSLAL